MRFSKRIEDLSPYFFSNISPLMKIAKEKEIDIINLAHGDPDLKPPDEVIEELKRALHDKDFHKYPSYFGITKLRERISEWMEKRFNVELDPKDEILVLRGTKHGILQLLLALCNNGDYVLIPDPAYPAYKASARFAGAVSIDIPLLYENDFLPDLDILKGHILRKAKVMILNYPNNPTGKRVEKDFFNKIVDFCRKWGIIIIHDNAYSEIFEDKPPPSILEADGAKEIAVELHSFSKTYNMQGFRIGWACGNRCILKALSVVKTNTEVGVFNPIQRAAVKALEVYDKFLPKVRKVYRKRRRLIKEYLGKGGCDYFDSDSTLYVWAKINFIKYKSMDVVHDLINKKRILVSPGAAYGKNGEGFLRFSITESQEKIKEGMERFVDYMREQMYRTKFIEGGEQ